MVRVLIVEDSYVARELLKHVFSLDKGIVVIGEAARGEEAIALLEKLKPDKPDVITMDIEMPGLDGYATTRKIMETSPIPIVIISVGYQYPSAEKAFRAMQAGAVAAIGKPPGPGHPDFSSKSKELISLVKSMAKVPVVRRYPHTAETVKEMPAQLQVEHRPYEIVVIGASTGGPPVIQSILSHLPGTFPLPIVIVQHIATGFAQSMAEWLSKTSDLEVSLASEGQIFLPGHVYLAPNNVHVTVGKDKRLHLVLPAEGEILVPSVGMLFDSVAENIGEPAIGILLTGMGKDGAEGLLKMKAKGALTLAQDRQSSIVYGMPGEAEKLGAACCHLSPEEIVTALLKTTSKQSQGEA